MTITDWLAQQKKILENCDFDSLFDELTRMRTEHERALKIIEKYREALARSECHYTELSINGYVKDRRHQADCIKCEALAYFPEVGDE